MTETRAPFNGNRKEPVGVFVRLHDGMLNEKQIAALCNPKRSSTENILTIGTPVTGGEMDYYAQIIWFEDAIEPEIVAWRNRDIKKGDNVKVVRQSDALAKLAEKDAEIARLNELVLHSKRENFNAGYLIACCNLCNMHNEESIAADLLSQVDITRSEVAAMDLSEYDSNALQIIRRSRIPDPILKDRRA